MSSSTSLTVVVLSMSAPKHWNLFLAGVFVLVCTCTTDVTHQGESFCLTQKFDQGLYTVLNCNWFLCSGPNILCVCVLCLVFISQVNKLSVQLVLLCCPTDVCIWTGLIGGLAVNCSVCVWVCVIGGLQERGVQSTGCSAWRWGLYYKGSPALLQ